MRFWFLGHSVSDCCFLLKIRLFATYWILSTLSITNIVYILYTNSIYTYHVWNERPRLQSESSWGLIPAGQRTKQCYCINISSYCVYLLWLSGFFWKINVWQDEWLGLRNNKFINSFSIELQTLWPGDPALWKVGPWPKTTIYRSEIESVCCQAPKSFIGFCSHFFLYDEKAS